MLGRRKDFSFGSPLMQCILINPFQERRERLGTSLIGANKALNAEYRLLILMCNETEWNDCVFIFIFIFISTTPGTREMLLPFQKINFFSKKTFIFAILFCEFSARIIEVLAH